jgi:hypothetical protein
LPERVDWSLAAGCLSVVTLVLATLILPQLVGQPSTTLPRAVAAAPPDVRVWMAVGFALLFWTWCLLRHQPAQRRRTIFVRRLRDDPDIGPVIKELDKVPAADLPPHWQAAWDVPERLLLPAARQAAALPASSRLRADILQRLGLSLPRWLDSFAIYLQQGDRMDDAQLQTLKDLQTLLADIPEGKALAEPYADYLAKLIDYTAERDPPRAEILRDLLTAVLKRGHARTD